jgi:hypothetical protein
MNQIVVGRQYIDPLTGQRVLIKDIGKKVANVCSWDYLNGSWAPTNPISCYELKFWKPYWVN